MTRRFLIPVPLRGEQVRDALLQTVAHLPDTRVLALIAPLGYGKTTFLAQLARATPHPTAWLNLTPDHANPATLTADVIAAYQGVAGPTTEGTIGDLNALARALVHAEQNIDLVLDNIECLSPSTAQLAGQLADQLPDGFRLFLAGHHAEHLPLTTWVAQGVAALLGPEQLRFSAEEVTATLGVDSDVEPAQLDRLDGWPVAISLLRRGSTPSLTFSSLLNRLLQTLPADVAAALPEAAALHVWSERHATLTGCDLPADWLQATRAAGLPLTPLPDGSLVPHAVLTEELERRLRRTPARHQALHRAAGQLAERDGHLVRAYQHALHANATEDAVRLLTALSGPYERHQEYEALQKLLEALPVGCRPGHLQELLALTLMHRGRVDAATHILQELPADQLGPRGHYALALRAGRHGQLDVQRTYLHLALTRQPPLHLAWMIRGLDGALLAAQGQTTQAIEDLQRLLRETAASGDRAAQADTLYILQSVYAASSRHHEQRQALQLAATLHQSLDRPRAAARVQLDLAEMNALHGDVDAAQAILNDLEGYCRTHHPPLLPFVLEQQADLDQRAQSHEGALRKYREAVSAYQAVGHYLLSGRVWLKQAATHAELGDQAQTDHALAMADLTQGEPASWYHDARQFTLGRLAHRRGAHDLAVHHYRQVGTQSPDLTHQVRARALRSALGDPAPEQAATGVFDMLDKLGTDDPLRRDGALIQPFLHAAHNGDHLTRCAAVLSDQRPEPAAPTSLHLEIRALGAVSFRVNGEAGRFPMSKGAELLSWLALHGTGNREQIVTDLWDGSNDPRHHEYFRVAVRRLRAVMRDLNPGVPDPIPYHAGVYRLHPQYLVAIDVKSLPEVTDSRAWLDVSLDAFLPEAESEWARTWRERARHDRLTGLTEAARLATLQEPPVAAQLYARLHEAEPDDADLLIAYCQTLLRLDRRQEAARVVQRHAVVMQRDFGVESDPAIAERALRPTT